MSAKLSLIKHPIKKLQICKSTKKKNIQQVTSTEMSLKELIDKKNTYYLQTKTELNYALWKHIVSILQKVLAERPENIVESFEQLSCVVKQMSLLDKIDLPDEEEENLEFSLESDSVYQSMKKYLELIKFSGPKPLEGEDGEGEEPSIQFDVCEQLRCFEEAGVGLPMLEKFHINAAMLRLSQTHPITKIRFWGKIFGLKKDYYIVECELKEEEIQLRRDVLKHSRLEVTERCRASQVLQIMSKVLIWKPTFVEPRSEEEQKLAILMKRRSKLKKYKIVPPYCVKPAKIISIPQERSGEGCNKKVYFVCNYPNEQWMMLPDVKPENIIAARKIKNFFSGHLEAPLTGEGPTTEIEYLRAQIARISAGTQISPLGFYSFGEGGEGEEEQEDEEGGESTGYRSYIKNPDFQPLPLRDLVEPTLSFWVHHTDHILKQGRVLWWNGKLPKDFGEGEGEEGQGDNEDEGEGEGTERAEEPEIGPSLLTPLSEDATLEGIPPWTARVSPQHLPQKFAIIRSNLWPGAFAYACGRSYDNVYFGLGVKFQHYGFPMSCTPILQKMYDIGPDVLEAVEPTLEMEEEWHLRNFKPQAPDEPLGGEGEYRHGEGEVEEEEETE